MKFIWRGETFEMVEQSDMSWLEVEKLEEATGYTSAELEQDPKLGGKARVIAAMCWVSVFRQNDKVEFGEFFGSKLSEFEQQNDGEEKTAVPPPPVDADDPLDDTAGSSSEDSGTST